MGLIDQDVISLHCTWPLLYYIPLCVEALAIVLT
jgi:hypothetical protein